MEVGLLLLFFALQIAPKLSYAFECRLLHGLGLRDWVFQKVVRAKFLLDVEGVNKVEVVFPLQQADFIVLDTCAELLMVLVHFELACHCSSHLFADLSYEDVRLLIDVRLENERAGQLVKVKEAAV